MSDVSLVYAGISYMDRTVPLEMGRIVPEGIDLNFVTFPSPGDLFRRQSQFAEFEASEMSLSTLIMMIARGDDRFVGIPVFPSRQFRHKDIYVNSDAGIDSPSDLMGKDVGILEYQMTAALWVRGILKHEYDVPAEKINWWTGGLRQPGYVARMAHDLPANVSLQVIPEDRTLEGMLELGELSALVTVNPPEALVQGSPAVHRLFSDYRAVERDYYKRTGFFPIMHIVALRRDVYERHPWIALNLVEAFTEAKLAGYRRLAALGTLAISLPWLASELEENDELFGGDPFPYGLEPNRAVLEAMTLYSYEQGLANRQVAIEELFAAETLGKQIHR
jgi:4,5-dihydroxyphthalate decarboxylase